MSKRRNLLEIYKGLDKKKKACVIAILSIFFVILWAFMAAGVITCKYNLSQMRSKIDNQKVDAIGIIITETKQGTKYFEIYGEDGTYSNDRSIATLNNVIGNFYKDDEVAMSFQSSKGSYDEKTGTITLYNNTYIVLKDNTSLAADSLVWSGSDKDTVATGNVKIKKDQDLYTTANECIISPGYDKFKVVGQTITRIYSNKEK